jgi:hypothetical protein
MADFEIPDGLGRWILRLLLVLLVCIVNGSTVLCVLRYPWCAKTRSLGVTRKARVEMEVMAGSFRLAGVDRNNEVKVRNKGRMSGVPDVEDTCVVF